MRRLSEFECRWPIVPRLATSDAARSRTTLARLWTGKSRCQQHFGAPQRDRYESGRFPRSRNGKGAQQRDRRPPRSLDLPWSAGQIFVLGRPRHCARPARGSESWQIGHRVGALSACIAQIVSDFMPGVGDRPPIAAAMPMPPGSPSSCVSRAAPGGQLPQLGGRAPGLPGQSRRVARGNMCARACMLRLSTASAAGPCVSWGGGDNRGPSAPAQLSSNLSVWRRLHMHRGRRRARPRGPEAEACRIPTHPTEFGGSRRDLSGALHRPVPDSGPGKN